MILLAVALCGVTFNVPAHWTARVEPDEDDARTHVRCRVAIRPKGYEDVVAHSVGAINDAPMVLRTFDSMDDALAATNFIWDGDHLIAIGRSDERAARFRVHRWSGWQARTWFRGWTKRDAELPEDAPHVFSASAFHYVIHSGKRVIAIRCFESPEDVTPGCEDATRILLRSLR